MQGGGARRRVGELATMMAGTRPKASGGGSIWKYLLPALVGCHLFVSFCFVQYFMPSDTPGMGFSMSSTADQVCRLHMRFRVWWDGVLASDGYGAECGSGGVDSWCICVSMHMPNPGRPRVGLC